MSADVTKLIDEVVPTRADDSLLHSRSTRSALDGGADWCKSDAGGDMSDFGAR